MVSIGKPSLWRRYTRRQPSGRKRVMSDPSLKRTRLHCLIENGLVYGLLTTIYDATDMPELGMDQSTDGRYQDHSYAIDFAQFLENVSIMSDYSINGIFGGSKVTIAQTCETDCPVLTSPRHVWTSRPRSSVRRPVFLYV